MATLNHGEITNYDRWCLYMRDVTSPDIFIEMGFYYLIASALQRRVYLGSEEKPLFLNLYIILTAEPGIGKGLVIKPVNDFLRYHKLRRMKLKDESKVDLTPEEMAAQLELAQNMLSEFSQVNGIPVPISNFDNKNNKVFRKPPEEPLTIPLACESTTYEALVRNHSQSMRSIIPANQRENKLLKNGIYTHATLCYALEEISSLFRKHTEDVINYLIKAYDCGDYSYDTKTQGRDYIKNMCLNFLGGTTPGFMKAAFNDKLLNEGFASRTLFVFAPKKRFERFDQSTFTIEQLEAKAHLLKHIEVLTTLFGRVSYTPEAHAFMKYYVEKVLPLESLGAPVKLQYYYARKRVHAEKLAAAVHFSNSTEMLIQLPSCHKALEICARLESTMERALEVGGRSPIGYIASKILKFLRLKGPQLFSEIWLHLSDDGNNSEITEALIMLQETQQILRTKEEPVKYYVPKNDKESK